MPDLIKEFAVFCITWYAVIVAVRILLTRLYVKLSGQMQADTELIEKLNKLVHSVKIEQQGDMYFWFDADDDIFIAQGQTDQEIQEVLRQSWQQHIFLLEKQQILLAGPKFDPICLNTTLTK